MSITVNLLDLFSKTSHVLKANQLSYTKVITMQKLKYNFRKL